MADITVFSVVRESECSECGTEIFRRALLRMENGKPLCMACADLDNLVWLPRGDAALTRRAGKYSTLKAGDRSFQPSTTTLRTPRHPGRGRRTGTRGRGVPGRRRGAIPCPRTGGAASRRRGRRLHGRVCQTNRRVLPGQPAQGTPTNRPSHLPSEFGPRRAFRSGKGLRRVGHRPGGARSCPSRAQPVRRVAGRGSGQTGRARGSSGRCRRRYPGVAGRRARLVGDALVASRADRTKAIGRRARQY